MANRYADMLNYLINGVDSKEKYPGSRAKSIIHQNVTYKTNKLESEPFQIDSPEIKTLLRRSQFHKLRQQLSRVLITEGKGALAMIQSQGDWYVMVMSNVNHTSIGMRELRVEGTMGGVMVVNNQQYPIWTVYEKRDGAVTISRVIKVTAEDGTVTVQDIAETEIIPGITELPVEVFYNNEMGLSDIDHFAVRGTLDRLSYLDQRLRPEYEFNKSMPYFNTNFTDNAPEKTTKEIKEGKEFIKEDSYNSQVKEGTQLIPSTGAYQLLQAACDHEEMLIREKLGMHELPGIEKGTNKHTAEIIYKQEYAIDVILSMRQMRENSYQQFFDKIAMVLDVEIIDIKLKLNPIVQSKIDLLKASVEAERGKVKTMGMQNTPTAETKKDGDL